MASGVSSSKIKAFVISITSFAAVLALIQLAPGTEGASGTPPAVVFLGIVLGLINALIAAGMILIYRTTRIINFAQASIGAAGGVFAYNLVVDERTAWPFIPAFVAGLLLAGLVGMVLELGFVRRFFNAPRLVLTVVTIALVGGLGFLASQIPQIPIFTPAAERTLEVEVGLVTPPLPYDDFQFTVGDLPRPFGFPHLFTIGMALLALAGLAAFFRLTKAGVAVRAASENADRATLLGINVKGLSTVVWGIAGLLSGVSVILTGIVGTFGGLNASAQPEQAAAALLPALAAAVLARMRSLPIAVLASLGIEVVRQAVIFSYVQHIALYDTGLFLVILIGLLLQRRSLGRAESAEISTWEATQELRPTPKEMLEVPGVKNWRRVLVAVAAVALLLFPWAMPAGPTSVAGFIALQGIVLLSLVVLTGWAGQVSLGQWALVGIGALIGGALTAKTGISFWVALPLGAVGVALFAVLIGVPALRIRGLFLAITTFALAVAVQSNLFNDRYFGWAIPDAVERPRLLLIDFEDERSMYYLCLAALGLAILVVTSLRRSRPGRILIALRENESNLQAFGVNPVRVRLAAFAMAGGLCGFAGVLVAHQQRDVGLTGFQATESLTLFLFAIIGGIGSVSGALLGTAFLTLNVVFGGNPFIPLLVGPVGVLVVLYAAPGGLASILYGLRDGVYRIIAQRRRMVVPSLFADVDPGAVERQLAPLAEPIPSAGLSVLPPSLRYRTASWLYSGRGKVDGRARRDRADAAAFSAAVKSAEGEISLETRSETTPERAGTSAGDEPSKSSRKGNPG